MSLAPHSSGPQQHESHYVLLLLGYVKFADRTGGKAASVIIPSVRITAPETHARLASLKIIRLACIPVGVCHCRHRGVCVRRSPDECGVTTRVDTLSSCPPVYSLVICKASTQ